MKNLLRWRGRDRKSRFSVTGTGWGESTHAEQAWRSYRNAASRWGITGAVIGGLVALVAFAPASWLTNAIANATGQTLLLADARGTVWNGSATAVLTGGTDSRDAAALPGRLYWSVGLRGFSGLEVRLTQPCCMTQPMVLALKPGLSQFTATLQPSRSGEAARWPAAWLAGLGTPWNTLQVGGELRFTSPGLTVEHVQGRWLLTGRAQIDLAQLSSRISTIEPLGSYRLTVAGDPNAPGSATLALETVDGALQLTGNGNWTPGGVRFRGTASAQQGSEAALNNLLNIIGRRSGAQSVISIG